MLTPPPLWLQVPGSVMDMNVLIACQTLLDQLVAEGNSPLLQQLYQHLLFDFRIWTRSHFAVCLGETRTRPSLVCEPAVSKSFEAGRSCTLRECVTKATLRRRHPL